MDAKSTCVPATGVSGRFIHLAQSAKRWNLFCHIADGMLAGLAFTLVNSMFVVAPFLRKIGLSDTVNGLLGGIMPFFSMLMPLLVAGYVSSKPRKKPFVLLTGIGLRLNGFLMAGLIFFLLPSDGKASETFILLYVAIQLLVQISGQAGGPAWTDLVAKTVPVDRRGFVFSWRANLGILASLGGLAFMKWALDNIRFPLNFAMLFLLNGVVFMISLIFVGLVRERGTRSANAERGPLFRGLPKLLRGNVNFSHFLMSRGCTGMAAGMVDIFLVLTARDRFGVPMEQIIPQYFLTMSISSFVGNYLFGRLGDKLGHKRVLLFEGPLFVAGCVWALLAQNVGQFGVVFVLLGLGKSALAVSGLAMAMEFAGEEDRPRFLAVHQATLGLMVLIGAPLGGFVREHFSFVAAFLLAISISIIGLLNLIFRVRDPRTAGIAK